MNRCVLASMIAVAVTTSRAAAVPREAWQLTHWTTDDGLPQNTVAAVAKDADGFVWLGTQEGLVRFDGDRFVVLDGLPCPSVLALTATGDGAIAVGTEGCGAFTLRGGRLRRLDDVPADLRVRAVARGAGGALVWGTDRGLIVTGDGAPRWLYRGDEVMAVAVRPGGGVAIATRTRVGEVGPAGVTWRSICTTADDNLWALAAVGDRLWVASRDHGLCAIDRDGAPRRFDTAAGLPSLAIKGLAVDGDGALWVATLGGAVRFDGAQFARVEGAGADLAAASVTPDGDLVWIGGQLTGLTLLRPRQVRTFTRADGLADDVVWAVFEDRAGGVWTSTEAGGLEELVGDRFVDRAPPGLDHDASIGVIAQAPDGTLWVGASVGLWHRRADGWEVFTTAAGLPSADTRAITFDRAGTMWVGTAAGLARRDAEGHFVDVTGALGLPAGAYDLIIPDPRTDGLWLGGPDVFGLLVGARFTPRALDGHPNVSAILVTDTGVLVGTGGGLARVTSTDVRWLRPAQGLVTSQVLALARRGDEVWITSNKGPARIAARELDAYFDGRAPRVTPIRYGKRDGMLSAECNTAGATSLQVTRDGRVWVPTVAGLAVFDPDHERDPATPPRVVLDRLVDHRGEVHAWFAGPITLALGRRDFDVTYTAPEFSAPDQLLFRYRLVGYDRTWIDAGNQRTIGYTNLGPGRYQLEIAARLPTTSWGPPAALTVVVPPHAYETRWFFGLALALGATLVGAVAYLGVTAARRRELALRARVRERTHELDVALARTATSEANFRNLLARMPVAVSLARAGQVLYANDEALRIAGATSWDQLRATPFAGPPEAGPAAPGGTAGEHRFAHADGSVALADLWYLALVHEGAPAVLCVGRDITRRKQLESMLRTTERMASIGTLAAGVAHEINNPLTYVLANLDLVAEELPRVIAGTADVPVLTGAITDAQHGASRVARIVRDLRTFSRPDDDREGPVDLGPVIESTLGLCRNEIRHRAALVVELEPVPPVHGTAHRLGQVLLNLVVNAAQAIPEGAIAANRITVRTHLRPDDRIELTVTDTGGGIPAAHLPRLCDPFFTTKPIGQGTGLGLSIVHGILTRFGGELAIESEVGRGSTFRVLLRRAVPAAPPPAASA